MRIPLTGLQPKIHSRGEEDESSAHSSSHHIWEKLQQENLNTQCPSSRLFFPVISNMEVETWPEHHSWLQPSFQPMENLIRERGCVRLMTVLQCQPTPRHVACLVSRGLWHRSGLVDLSLLEDDQGRAQTNPWGATYVSAQWAVWVSSRLQLHSHNLFLTLCYVVNSVFLCVEQLFLIVFWQITALFWLNIHTINLI